MNKKITIVASVLLSTLLLTACSSQSSTSSTSSKSTLKVSQSSTSSQSSSSTASSSETSSEKGEYTIDYFAQLAAKSKSVDETYVVDDLVVGQGKDIEPGIYDLEVTGGSGSISIDREISDFYGSSWSLSAKGTDSNYPSVVRVILMEGDKIEFSSISKIKLTAVKTAKASTELGEGNYVVRRDIEAGTYKLSTNISLDDEFSDLGWTIDTSNLNTEDSRSQELTPNNADVAIKLEEGEVLTTSLSLSYGDDNAKLIFTKLN